MHYAHDLHICVDVLTDFRCSQRRAHRTQTFHLQHHAHAQTGPLLQRTGGGPDLQYCSVARWYSGLSGSIFRSLANRTCTRLNPGAAQPAILRSAGSATKWKHTNELTGLPAFAGPTERTQVSVRLQTAAAAAPRARVFVCMCCAFNNFESTYISSIACVALCAGALLQASAVSCTCKDRYLHMLHATCAHLAARKPTSAGRAVAPAWQR